MYYVLDCMSPLGAEFYNVELKSLANRKRWEAGVLFTPSNEIPEFRPPQGTIELVTEEDSTGVPHVYAELYWDPLPIFSRRLVAALEAAGVDNLQTYDTTLVSVEGKNPPPPNHYRAVNVVGRVAAADLEKSEINPDVDDREVSTDFYSLSVDETKAKDLLMFRLVENISVVLVHERVKAQVEAAGITTLSWFQPEEWAG
jgi:hypothetical protein